MCLAIPAKVLEVNGDMAKVDFGGVQRNVILTLIDSVEVGEYLLIHAGYAIEKQSPEYAEETLKMMSDFVESRSETPRPDA